MTTGQALRAGRPGTAAGGLFGMREPAQGNPFMNAKPLEYCPLDQCPTEGQLARSPEPARPAAPAGSRKLQFLIVR
jgi:hypothetical protein